MDKMKGVGDSGVPVPASSSSSQGKKLVGPYLLDVFHSNVSPLSPEGKISSNVTSGQTLSHAERASAIFHRTFEGTGASQREAPLTITHSQLKVLASHVPSLHGTIGEIAKDKADTDSLSPNEVEKLKQSLEFREYLKTRNAEGQTPLIEAITNADNEMTKVLLALEVNPNETDNESNTPLFIALVLDRPGMMKLLLEAGANPNAPNNFFPILQFAVRKENEEAVELLLRYGANPNYLMNYDLAGDYLPLKEAVRNQNEEILKLLIRYGVNPNLLSKEDQKGLKELVPLKIRKSDPDYKPINPKIKFEASPKITYGELLEWSKGFDETSAKEQSYIKKIQAISDENADDYDADYYLAKEDLRSIKKTFNEDYWNKLDDEGNTQLINAIDQGDPEKVKFCIAFGADINFRNREGDSPLCRAINKPDMKMVKLLLSYGADPNALDKQNYRALSIAMKMGNHELIELLLSYGANPHLVDTSLSIGYRQIEILRQLLAFGANPDAPTLVGGNGLQLAVLHEDKHLMELFLGTGANPNPIDVKAAEYSLYRALTMEKTEIAKLLVEYGADLEFAQKIVVTKVISAIHGLKGTQTITNKDGTKYEVPVEGFYPPNVTKVLLNYLQYLFSLSANKVPAETTGKIIKALSNPLIKASIEPNAEGTNALNDAYARYQTSEPVLVFGGTGGHAVTIIFERGKDGKPGKIIVCNRGMGARDREERAFAGVYSIPSDATEAEIKGLMNKFRTSYGDMDLFNEMIEDEINQKHIALPSKQLDRTISVDKKEFEEIYQDLTQKIQKVGNCTWANVKSALLVMLVLELGQEEGKAAYKEITKAIRDLSAEWLINTYPDLVDLIDAIQRKKQIKTERKNPSPKQEWISRNALENYKVDPITLAQLEEFAIYFPDDWHDMKEVISGIKAKKVDPSDIITTEDVMKIRAAIQNHPGNTFSEDMLRNQIADGKSELITFILAVAANPDGSNSDLVTKTNPYGHDILFRSLHVGTPKTTELLLHYGANPNVQYEDGTTPLIIAEKAKKEAQKAVLEKYGATPPPKPQWISKNPVENYPVQPITTGKLQSFLDFDLRNAAEEVKAAVSAVLQRKSSPTDIITQDDVIEIRKAFQEHPDKELIRDALLSNLSNTGMVTFILALEVDLDGVSKALSEKDRYGSTVLFDTIYRDAGITTELFLYYGADPNVKNQFGETPLALADNFKNEKIKEILLRYGAVSKE